MNQNIGIKAAEPIIAAALGAALSAADQVKGSVPEELREAGNLIKSEDGNTGDLVTNLGDLTKDIYSEMSKTFEKLYNAWMEYCEKSIANEEAASEEMTQAKSEMDDIKSRLTALMNK